MLIIVWFWKQRSIRRRLAWKRRPSLENGVVKSGVGFILSVTALLLEARAADSGFGPRWMKKKVLVPHQRRTDKKPLHKIGKTNSQLQSDWGLDWQNELVQSTDTDTVEKYNIYIIIGPRVPVICTGFPPPLSSPRPKATIYWESVPFPRRHYKM